MSGYSKKPLVEKLDFKPGETLFVEDTPDWYSSFASQHKLDLTPGLPATHAHIFCDSKQVLDEFLQTAKLKEIEKSLWVSWPKKSSGIKTDISEQDFRDAILPLGWVDVKVAAVDEVWSGLKFLRRKA